MKPLHKGHYGKYTGNAPCCADHAHTKVTKENYKNYFENAYNKDAYKNYVKKDSTLKRKPKNYKD